MITKIMIVTILNKNNDEITIMEIKTYIYIYLCTAIFIHLNSKSSQLRGMLDIKSMVNSKLLYFEWSKSWHSFWHSIWHAFWHSIWHSMLYFIWHSVWHSIWHSTWNFIWHTFWHSIWHSMLYSIWHSTWHLFWYSMIPSATLFGTIWHVFRSRRVPQPAGLAICCSGPGLTHCIRSWQRGWTQQRGRGEEEEGVAPFFVQI